MGEGTSSLCVRHLANSKIMTYPSNVEGRGGGGSVTHTTHVPVTDAQSNPERSVVDTRLEDQAPRRRKALLSLAMLERPSPPACCSADLRIARACTAGWLDGRRGPLRFVKIPAELRLARGELPPVSVTAMFTSRFGGEERFEGGEDSLASCRRSPSGDSLTDVAAASVSPPKDGPASSLSSSAAVSSSSSSPPCR